MIRRIFITALCLFGLCLYAAPALAHSELGSADPAPNTELATAPDHITLRFTEELNADLSTVVVYDQNHKPVQGTLKLDAKGAQMTVVFPHPLAKGYYTVAWTTVGADDGHLLRDNYVLAVQEPVGGGQSSAQPALTPVKGSGNPLQVLGRWLWWAGLYFWAGALFWRFLIKRPWGVGPEPLKNGKLYAAAGARLLSITRWGAALAAGGLLLVVVVQAYLLAGGWPLSVSLWQNLLWNSRPEMLTSVRIVLAILGAVLAARHLFGALLAVASLVLSGLAGHALAVDTMPAVSAAADLVHLVSTALWGGGLLAFGLAIVWPEKKHLSWIIRQAERFAPWALTSVVLIVLTGIVNTRFEVGSLANLTGTDYGRMLLVKIGLVLLLVALSAVHAIVLRRRVKTDRASVESPTGRWLYRAMAAQMPVALLVLLSTAVLTSMAPPRSANAAVNTAPGADSVVWAEQVGPYQLRMALVLTQSGPMPVSVTLLNPLGNPVDDAKVSLAVTPQAAWGQANSLQGQGLRDQGAGVYVGNVREIAAGAYTLDLTIQRKGDEVVTAREPVMLPATDGHDILQKGTERFLRLHSAHTVQTAVYGTQVQKLDFLYEAPGQVHYKEAETGVEIIGAPGNVAYTRESPKDPWQPMQWGGFQWPYVRWSANLRNVHVIGTDTVDDHPAQVVTFEDVKNGGDVFYRVWVDKDDNLIRKFSLVDGQQYSIFENSEFDKPFGIKLPTAGQSGQ